MKTILRNFFSVLRRFKAASVLNVLGLSIAFVAFINSTSNLYPSDMRCEIQ